MNATKQFSWASGMESTAVKRKQGDGVFSLEQRMCKKAAMDLAREQAEITEKRRMVRFNGKGEQIYTLDSLPPDMFHIGDLNIARVSCFSGLTRVDIRKYVQDDEECLHPRTDGVSISPEVWENLLNKINHFLDKRVNDMIVIKRDLCVSGQLEDSEILICFQRLFQRKNHYFEFVPKRIFLISKHINKLLQFSGDISSGIKEGLLRYSMEFFVKKELSDSLQTNSADVVPDNPVGLSDLTKVLVKVLKKHIAHIISELFPCKGCRDPDGFSIGPHDCATTSAEDKISEYFSQSLYTVDWKQISHDFVSENVSNVHFTNLIFTYDFFFHLNVGDVFDAVKDLYIQEENVLYKSSVEYM